MTDFEYIKYVSAIKDAELTPEQIKLISDEIDKSSGLTKEQYDGLKKALDDAADSSIPFPVVAGDSIKVVGDPNKTELRKFEYEMLFERPVYDADGNLTDKIDKEKKTYRNVFVKPRINAQIIKWLASILPYFYKIDENGEQHEYTQIEMIQLYGSLSWETIDLMYELVAVVLGIDEKDKDFMNSAYVIECVTKFIQDNPQTANEAMTFFS